MYSPTMHEDPAAYWADAEIVEKNEDGTQTWEGPDGKWVCVTDPDCCPGDAEGSTTYDAAFFWQIE